MAVNLSPVGGVAAQFFTNSGVVLTGGKIYTYAAGTTTNQATYTSSSGSTAHPNPIILDAAGRVPGGEIWLTDGLQYKFVLKDSNEVLIGTYDNIIGINSNFVNFTNSQEIQTATASQTVFTLTTMEYQPGTGSLSVFVDGVNQYGPSASYAYVETSSTVVTFVTGLHVGASVKFTTSSINASSYGTAADISYTPAGTGAVTTNVQAKLRQYVSVKDFGAVGNGVADDTAAIQAAVTAGYTVLFPAGNYKVTSQISCTSGNWLVGEGAGETIITAATDVSPLLFEYPSVSDYTGAGITKMTVRGTGAAVCLVEVINIWGFVAEYCRIFGLGAVQDCLRISKFAFEPYINSCRITDADRYGLFLKDDGGEFPNGATVINCDFSGNDGATLIRSEANNVKIIGNWFEYAGTDGGTCISATKRIHIIGNKITTGVNGDNSIYLSSAVRGALIQNNRIVTNGTASKGIFLDAARDVIVQGNHFLIDSVDIVAHCKGSTNTVIQGNAYQFIAGGLYSANDVIALTDSASGTVVDANMITYTGSAGTRSGNGIRIDNGVTVSTVTANYVTGFVVGIKCDTNASNRRVTIVDNQVTGNNTAITVANVLDVFIKNNNGFVTENRGTGTIASGSTSVVINHGLALTPGGNQFIITPTNSPTNDPGNLFISGTPTSVDVAFACRNDPGASGANFGWRVSISE